MDLKLLKDTLRHYNFVLDKCRDDKMFTIGRIKKFRDEIRQLKTQIDIIERWQKLSSVPQANELLQQVSNRRELLLAYENFHNTCECDFCKTAMTEKIDAFLSQ